MNIDDISKLTVLADILNDRKIKFKVTSKENNSCEVKDFDVTFRGLTTIDYYEMSIILFNSCDFIEYISVYEAQGFLRVLTRGVELDKDFFEYLKDKIKAEEEVYYNKHNSNLKEYIRYSLRFKDYNDSRFTNFLYLGQQAMLKKKRGK